MKTQIPLLTFTFIFAIVNKTWAQATGLPVYQFGILNHGGTNSKCEPTPTQQYGPAAKIKLLSGNFNENVSTDTSGKAVLIASNNNFNIYKLPMDNMPCLVPGKSFHSNMNTMEQEFNKKMSSTGNDKIPNPFKKQELIPSGK